MLDEALIKPILDKARTRRVIAFDTETTGLGESDEICQIAAVEYVKGTKTRSFNEYLRIPFPMPPRAEAIHGVGDAFLKANGVSPAAGLRRFMGLLDKEVLLVAHNVRFDLRMLNGSCRKHRVRRLSDRIMVCDTLWLAKAILPGLESYCLWSLIDELGVCGENSHRAQDDASACGEVFFKLLDRAAQKLNVGQTLNGKAGSIGAS